MSIIAHFALLLASFYFLGYYTMVDDFDNMDIVTCYIACVTSIYSFMYLLLQVAIMAG